MDLNTIQNTDWVVIVHLRIERLLQQFTPMSRGSVDRSKQELSF